MTGDVRSKTGIQHSLSADTLIAFKDAGCEQYNKAILLTALGTAPARAEKIMRAASKLVNTHQDVTVFVKGQSFTPDDARELGIRAHENSQPIE